jgi:hypothetical protein
MRRLLPRIVSASSPRRWPLSHSGHHSLHQTTGQARFEGIPDVHYGDDDHSRVEHGASRSGRSRARRSRASQSTCEVVTSGRHFSRASAPPSN